MINYILRRIFLIIPTLLGILVVNFLIIQAAPGEPVEKVIAQIKGNEVSVTERFSSSGGEQTNTAQNKIQSNFNDSKYRGSQGIDPDLIKELEKQYGFDKPAYQRFFLMLKNYVMFDFGESFYKDKKVIELIMKVKSNKYREKVEIPMNAKVALSDIDLVIQEVLNKPTVNINVA